MIEAYPYYEEWLARLQLVCFMIGMGVTLAVADFIKVARQPRSLLLGLVGQICVLPLIALAINRLLGLEGGIAVGLILVAAMPGGSLSKVFAYLGRGNAPLSITLTAVSTLATVVTVPVTLGLLATVPGDFAMPIDKIVTDVVLYLLAPLAIGMSLGRLWPERQRTISRWAVRAGFVPLLLIVVGSIAAGRIHPAEYGFRVPLAIILFCVLGPQLNMAPFYLLRLPRPDRLAVGIEATMRNVNLALLLKSSLFGAEGYIADGVLFVVYFYGAAAFFAGGLLTLNHRRLARRDESRRAAAASASASSSSSSDPGAASDAPAGAASDTR